MSKINMNLNNLLQLRVIISFKIVLLLCLFNLVTALTLPRHTKVVIVGAGVSGVGAANKLLENGISDVVVLEAMNKVGGRISWVDLGSFGGVDIGGHWIHGQNGNVVYEIAEPLGLVDHSGDYLNQLFFRPDGTQLKLNKLFYELYEYLFGDIHLMNNTQKYKSFADIVNERLDMYGDNFNLTKSDIRLLKYHARMNLCTLDGCADLSDVSAKASNEYEEGEGDKLIEWKSGGMSNILRLLMGTHEKSPWKGLGVEKKVKVYSRVAKIYWSSQDTVTVVTESGLKYRADFVIFTPSLNVLKNKHKRIFYPSLPKPKINAIEALGMDVVDKIYLVFEKRWWPKGVTGFNPLHSKEFPSETDDWGDAIISFVSENHNPHVLGVWITGSGAKRMELASDYEVKITAMRILRQHVGKTYTVPDPVFVLRSRWWNNQDVAGSYSYNSIASEHLNNPRGSLAAPLVNNRGKPMVLFAGEATSRHHYSTVNGALETGWREAQRIIDYLNNNKNY